MEVVTGPSADLWSFFDRHRTLRAVIECGLAGTAGVLHVDDATRPSMALLRLGCYAIPGGTPGVAASRMLGSIPGGVELVLPDDPAWRRAADAALGSRMQDRTMRTFDPTPLDTDHLRGLVAAAAAVAETRPIDEQTVGALDSDLEPHGVQVLQDAERFLELGVGFVALVDGTVVSQASSYAISRERVEVAIATLPEHRGKGLAAAVGARMLLHCLGIGRRPEWSASDPTSKRLALRLGYGRGPLCDSVMV